MKKILPLLFFMMAICSKNNAQVADSFLLNENFDRNKIGWIEEFTDAHYTGIKDGFFFLTGMLDDSTVELVLTGATYCVDDSARGSSIIG